MPNFGVEGSIFGVKPSEALITLYSASMPPNQVLRKFMMDEALLSMNQSKTADERDDWADARNVFHLPNKEEQILAGVDVEYLREKLQTKNSPYYKTLADVYLAARKRLFPQAKEV